MIRLLSKWFIKDADNVSDPRVRASYGTLCSVVAIVLNLCLFTAKIIVGTKIASLSVSADAINNLTDAGSSLLVLIGFRLACRKPDPEHPFGHGRFEYVTGMIVAGLILFAGAESAISAVRELIALIGGKASDVEYSVAAVIVLASSVAVKCYMAIYMHAIGKKIDSDVMKTTSADALNDCISTGLAIASVLLAHFFGWTFLDAVAGLIVSFLILRTGYEGAADTLKKLLGTKPSPERIQEIEEVVYTFPDIIGIHDLIVHDYGPGRFFVSLHAEVDGARDVYELHDTIDCAMAELDRRLGCESVIHMDPVDAGNEQLSILKESVASIVKEIDPALNMHDFRMVPGPTHTNLVFDVITPHAYHISDETLRGRISSAVLAKHPNHYCAIKIERSYV